ncbi:MAG: transglutaminase-like domain-containing protein [Verrucomicrobiota bacterium]
MRPESKKKAVESLVQDNDKRTRRLLYSELAADPEAHEKLVRQLSESACPDVRRFAGAILNEWEKIHEMAHCDDPVREAPKPECWEHLEFFCWWLAEQEYSDFKSLDGHRQLNEWSEEFQESTEDIRDPQEQIHELTRFIACEKQLCGDADTYYCPENSYLNRVIERGKGIPLSLSLIYIFIGQRIGWEVSGLNMPGHFLARIKDTAFDPYHGGKILACSDLAERYYLPEDEFEDLNLFAATPKEIAQRILGNLYNSYSRIEDYQRLERIGNYLQELSESD